MKEQAAIAPEAQATDGASDPFGSTSGAASRAAAPGRDLEAAVAIESEIAVARAAFDAGAYDEVVSRLLPLAEDASATGPDHVVQAHGMALALLGRAQDSLADSEGAAGSFRRTVELLSAVPESALEPAALRDLGIALAHTGEGERGVEFLQRALAAVSGEIHQQLGWTHLMIGRPHEAVESFRRALEVNPTDGVSLLGLPRALEAEGEIEPAAAAYHRAGEKVLEAGLPPLALEQFDRALEIAPKSPETLALRADALRQLGRWDEARAAVTDALALRPELPTALITGALIDLARGEQDQALAKVTELLRVDPAHAVGLALRANLRFMGGESDLALEDALAATATAPNNALVVGLLGQIRSSRGDNDGALRDLDRAAELDPGWPWPQAMRAEILFGQHRLPEALLAADRVVALSPGEVHPLAVRATILSALRRPDEAIATLQLAAQDGRLPAELQFTLGEALMLAGRLDEALPALRAATRHEPASASAFASLGECLRRLGRAADASRALNTAIRLEPSNAMAVGTLGQVRFMTKSFAKSLELLDRAIAIDPGLAWVHAARSDTLKALARPDEAVEEISAAVALEPAASAYQAARGELLRALGRYDEALVALNAALELDPRNWYALGTRGQVLRAMEDLPRAISDLEEALAGDPSLMWAEVDLGLAFWTTYDYPSAISHFEIAFARKSETPFARAAYGDSLRETGKLSEGLAALDAALVLDPDIAMAHVSRAAALRDLEDYDSALTAVGRALALDPEYAWALLIEGQLLVAVGRFADSVIRLEKVSKVTARDASTSGQLGFALMHLPRGERRALRALTKAVRLQPDDATYAARKADVLATLDRRTEADALYRRTVDRYRSAAPDVAAQYQDVGSVAWCLYRLGDVAEAARLLRRVLSREPDNLSSQLDLALVLMSAGDEEVAALEYAQGLAAVAKHRSQWRQRGLLAVALHDIRTAGPGASRRSIAQEMEERLAAELARLEEKLGAPSAFDPKASG